MCACTSGVPSPMIALGVCRSVWSGPAVAPLLFATVHLLLCFGQAFARFINVNRFYFIRKFRI